MFALRNLARSAPRATAQFSSRSLSRQLSSLRIAVPVRAISPASRFVAPFSSTSIKLQDDALAVKLAQEIKVETDLKNSSSEEGDLEGIESFSPPNDFKLIDTPGEEEVVLTKTHNNEDIRITFSIADINNEPMETEPLDESYDEEDGSEKAPKAEGEEAEDSYPSESFPIKLDIQITKSDKAGALSIECHAQDGDLMIENMYYFTDKDVAAAKTYDQEKKRANAYAGPLIGNLDEELQGLIGNYLGERGVDALLAEWVADYIDAKEQKEYVGWLKGVKEFVE